MKTKTVYRIRTIDEQDFIYMINDIHGKRLAIRGYGLPLEFSDPKEAYEVVKEVRPMQSGGIANIFKLEEVELVEFTRTEKVLEWNTGLV